MQKTQMKKLLSLILCMVLIAAMALFVTGCSDKSTETEEYTTASYESGSVLGEGEKSFTFTVTDVDGNESTFEVKTDKTTVGDALLDTGIIAGEDSKYGLFVKNVNGITADFDVDGTYWAFYIDGEYAISGVDDTDIEEGVTYSLKVEK